jgi:nitrate reductase gamma subunit
MPDTWIEIARGPLFRLALAVLLLGLLYRVGVVAAQIVASWRRAGDRRLPGRAVAAATLGWVLPRRLLRARPFYSALSFLFHVGILVVPPFLLGHVALLDGVLPAAWPTLPPVTADTLTLVALGSIALLVIGRLAGRTSRMLSKPQDVLLLLALLVLLLSGFLASHPALSPIGARPMLLIHLLMGNLVLILTPVTKIVHCVLFPFTQLVFELGWHFPAESGRHVALTLGKESEPV